jgi:hypothetical protein
MKNRTILNGLLDGGADHIRVSGTNGIHATLTRLPVVAQRLLKPGAGILRPACLGLLPHFNVYLRFITFTFDLDYCQEISAQGEAKKGRSAFGKAPAFRGMNRNSFAASSGIDSKAATKGRR